MHRSTVVGVPSRSMCGAIAYTYSPGTLSLSPRRDSRQQLLLVWVIKMGDEEEPGPQAVSRLRNPRLRPLQNLRPRPLQNPRPRPLLCKRTPG